jgi:hypothetical protein
MCVLFWFRKTVNNNPPKKNITTPASPPGFIQMRVTYNTERSELGSTHIECIKSQWDEINQCFKGKSVWALEQNKKLSTLKHKIEQLTERLERDTDEVTVHLIKSQFSDRQRTRSGKGDKLQRRTVPNLIEVFAFHYEYQERRKQLGKLEKATLEIQANYAANVADYLRLVKKAKLPATSINDDFMEDLISHFALVEKFGNKHTENHLKFIKQVMKWAKSKEVISKNPLADYRVETSEEDLDTTHLTIEQLQRLIDFDFFALAESGKIQLISAEALDKERDAFVFNCFTGMHHCDYTSKKFRIEQEGINYWLMGERLKTGKEFFLKLLEPSVAVLHKYGALQRLPAKSNQKRNDTLKLIAAYVELPMNLSTKIARKTFADLALNEMLIPADDVATMLGLASTARLKHYARPRRTRLAKLLTSWETLAANNATQVVNY